MRPNTPTDPQGERRGVSSDKEGDWRQIRCWSVGRLQLELVSTDLQRCSCSIILTAAASFSFFHFLCDSFSSSSSHSAVLNRKRRNSLTTAHHSTHTRPLSSIIKGQSSSSSRSEECSIQDPHLSLMCAHASYQNKTSNPRIQVAFK